MAKKTPWDEIRSAYKTEFADTGSVDLQRLAARFKVHYGTLRNKSSEQGWRAEADELRAEVVKQTAVLAVPTIVRHRVDIMEKHLTFLGQVRQLALNQIGEAVKLKQLPLKDALKLVFDSLRAEKMLQDMVSDGPTKDMTEDEVEQAMFNRFVERFGLNPEPATAEEQAAAH